MAISLGPVATSADGGALDVAAILARIPLRAGQRVADLGCGVTGSFIIPAARVVGREGMAFAVDVQKSALAATESRAKLEGLANIELVWSDIEREGATRIPQGTLDAVLIVNTLFLTAARDAVLREAARLLKSGGVVLVVEWVPRETPVGPPVAARITPDVVRSAARAAGLAEREAFDVGAHHYGIIFVK